MTVEDGLSLDTTETSDDSTAASSSGATEIPPAAGESARAKVLATITRWPRSCLAHWRLALAAALVVATMAVAVGLFFTKYRPDQQIDDAAARQAIQAASDGAVALLTYSYDSLDRDFAKAKSHLTGGFLTYYDKFSQLGVAPAAQEEQLTTTAKVVRAAVAELQPNSAMVLVFLNQTTASKKKPDTLTTVSSVMVTLTKVKGSWLIENVDPLS